MRIAALFYVTPVRHAQNLETFPGDSCTILAQCSRRAPLVGLSLVEQRLMGVREGSRELVPARLVLLALFVCGVGSPFLMAQDDKDRPPARDKPQTLTQNKPVAVCKRNPVGFRAPELKTPQDAASALPQKAVFAPWWIYRNTISPLFTALKHAGLRGWTDYCSEACAAGTVVHAVSGIDGFYTVDLALTEFEVNGQATRLEGPRFVRVEMYGKAKKETHRLPRKSDSVRICGKLMWDGDGFLEVHPRNAEDTEVLVAQPQRAD